MIAIEVAYMIVQSNFTYYNIAQKMYVSDKTISKHASNIFKKTGVSSRKEFMTTYIIAEKKLS
jgi:DNA-binding NarL/FixJ family response regulator